MNFDGHEVLQVRLADSDTVDYLSVEKGGGTVVVTLLDDFEGPELLQRLALLQRKLNRYFDFIESGEVFEQLARTTGRRVKRATPVRIEIVAKQELEGEGERFLRQVKSAAQDASVSLSFRVLEP